VRAWVFGALVLALVSCSREREVRRPTESDARAAVVALRTLGVLGPIGARAHEPSAEFPETADGRVTLGAADTSLVIVAEGARNVPRSYVDGAAVYPGAIDGDDVVWVSTGSIVEELRVLRAPRQRFEARYKLFPGPTIASIRVREGHVECIDESGRVRLGTAPMFALDARGERRDLTPRLEATGDATTLVVEGSLDGMTPPIAIDPVWSAVASLSVARSYPQGLRLADGTYMVHAGRGTSGYVSSTEIYDPSANTWTLTATGPVNVFTHLVQVPSGRVLVWAYGSVQEVYAYSPTAKTWSSLSSQPTPAIKAGLHGYTLPGGRAIFFDRDGGVSIFDDATSTWKAGKQDPEKRNSMAVNVLPDGRVLVAGGIVGASTWEKLSTAEIYDPGADTWTSLPPLAGRRYDAFAHRLSDGKILVGGGRTAAGSVANYNEVWDPATNTWKVDSYVSAGNGPANSRVIVSGGRVVSADGLNFLLVQGGDKPWALIEQPSPVRSGASDLPLDGGKFLKIGGEASGVASAITEIFTPIPPGGACNVIYPGSCTGGFCNGGTCCDSPCTGTCESCTVVGSEGTCTSVVGPPKTGGACAPYANCTSTGCATTCTANTDCLAGNYCDAGKCAPKLANGAACTLATACTSGRCVDGFCCDAACTGQCEACNVPGALGKCVAVVGAPRAPHAPCADAGKECGTVCNGTTRTTCVYLPAGSSPCGSNACTAGVETHASSCDGAGKCADSPKSCGNYACGTTACKSACGSRTDCVAGFVCVSNACVTAPGLGAACTEGSACSTGFCVDGVCCAVAACSAGSSCNVVGKRGTCIKNAGVACTVGDECATGKCVDGVCCEGDCAGQCEACNVAGQLGKCTKVVGAPRGARAACATDTANPCASRVCDGLDGNACGGYVAADVRCRKDSCASGVATVAAACDGKGACPAATTVACGTFACDPAGERCREVCATEADCAPDHQCVGGKCVVRRAACSDDGLAAVAADGTLTRCAPFRCKGGACGTSCATTGDCAPGSLCDPSGACVDPNVATDDGGGCTMGRRGGPSWLVGTLLFGMLLRRRRLALLFAMLTGCTARTTRDPSPDAGALEDVASQLARFPSIAARMTTEQRLTRADGRFVRDRGLSFEALANGTTVLADPADQRVRVEIAPIDLAVVQGVANGGVLVHRDARAGTDVALVATREGFEELRLIHRPDAPNNASWSVRLGPGLAELTLVDGRVLGRDANGAVRVACDAPFVVDAGGITRAAPLTLKPIDGGYRLELSFDPTGLAYPLVLDPAWSVGTETVFAYKDAYPDSKVFAFDMPDGSVFLLGNGYSNLNTAFAERFVPSTGVSRGSINTLTHFRKSAVAPLPSGRVLVAGGNPTSTTASSSASIYDPTTDAWTSTTSLATARLAPAFANLSTTRVLVAGGFGGGALLSSVEIFDSTTSTWSAGPAMPTARYGARAVALGAGRILVLGGRTDLTPSGTATWTSTVELFDGASWTSRAPMPGARRVHSTALLPSGKLLAVIPSGGSLSVIEIYDPTADSWTTTGPLAATRTDPVLAKLPNGRVLLTNGNAGRADIYKTSAAEVYDPGSNAWLPAMFNARWRGESAAHTLPDGRVMIFAGAHATNDPALRVEYFALQANGAACSAAGECSSALCVDGVCCDKPCTGACEACNSTGKLGVCSPISGPPAAQHPSCAPYVSCTAGACATTCSTDADCCGSRDACCKDTTCPTTFQGAYCSGGTCVAKQLNGAAATGARECLSGFVADGVCCDAPCTGQCEACNLSGKIGTCSAITGAPRGSRPPCEASTSLECAARCDGVATGICTFPPSTTPCSADACATGIETHRRLCDGVGRCGDVPKTCGAYVCGTTACKTSCSTHSDCAAGFACSSGACVPAPGLGAACSTSTPCHPSLFCTDGVCCSTSACASGTKCNLAASLGTCAKDNGSPCTGKAECGSGSCVDGYCCDATCDGQCQACDVAGALGRCTPVKGAPHAARPACASSKDRPCEGELCDGSDGSRCAALVGSEVTCRAVSCENGALIASASCDGTGVCPAPVKTACAPFGCATDGKACATSCATLDECAPGFLCIDTKCVKPTARCSDDGVSVVDAAGRAASCAPLRCRDGACLDKCATSGDCVTGTVCDGDGRCILAPSTAPTGSDEGGCAISSRSAGGRGVSLLVLLLVLRRRRRPRSA